MQRVSAKSEAMMDARSSKALEFRKNLLRKFFKRTANVLT